MRYFLGVDVGGTKTHALIADEKGSALGLGRAGPGNHEMVGYPGLRKALQQAVEQALQAARIGKEAIVGAGFGVAGYDWPSERQPTLEAIGTLGLNCPVEAVNDTLIGLLAGAQQGWGVAVVAGTSNNCRGRDRHSREGRVAGSGMWLGEYGGGGEIVMKAVHAVNYQWIKRGPETQLTQAFLKLTGLSEVAQLIEGIATYQIQPDASWALVVFEVASQGDPVAQQVLAWAGCELGELACAVIRQLGIEQEAFEVVLVGSLYEGGVLLTEPMRQTIHALAPKARLVRLDAPPVIGGVLLGMEIAGFDGYPLRDRLRETARALIGTAEAANQRRSA